MRTTAHGVLALAAVLGITVGAFGQGALERLEKRQFGGKKPAPKEAAAKPAEPGYLGVVTEDERVRGRGVQVVEIVAGSPAEKAGIRVRDLITAINGKPVRQTSDVPSAMKGAVVGADVGITLIRNGRTRTIHVTLGRRPRDPNIPPPPPKKPQPAPAKVEAKRPAQNPRQPQPGPPLLGAVMRTYVEDPRLVFGRPPLRGAQITEVLANTPAATARLRPGDIVVALNGRGIADFQDLQEMVALYRPGTDIRLTFYRGRTQISQRVRLASAAGPAKVPAVDAPSDQQRIEALKQRVRELERRIAELEKKLSEKP